MRAIFSTMLIILASSTLGKEATLEQHLKDDTDLSQVSLLARSIRWLGYTTVDGIYSPSVLRMRQATRESVSWIANVTEWLCNRMESATPMANALYIYWPC